MRVALYALLYQLALCNRFFDYVIRNPLRCARSDPRRRRRRAQRGRKSPLHPYWCYYSQHK